MVRQQGFSIIELMITVVIVAIIMAIAVPAYTDSKRRTARVEAQAELIAIAQKLAAYKMSNGSYAGADIQKIYGQNQLLQSSEATYTLQLSATTAIPTTTWTLNAIPIGKQIKDGTLQINDRNQQCWFKGQPTPSGTCLSWSEK